MNSARIGRFAFIEPVVENVVYLDYSVAQGEVRCAYRWNSEQKLSNDNLVWLQGG